MKRKQIFISEGQEGQLLVEGKKMGEGIGETVRRIINEYFVRQKVAKERELAVLEGIQDGTKAE